MEKNDYFKAPDVMKTALRAISNLSEEEINDRDAKFHKIRQRLRTPSIENKIRTIENSIRQFENSKLPHKREKISKLKSEVKRLKLEMDSQKN